MAEINFEKIRNDALAEATKGLEENTYGEMIRQYADISSQVAKLMLEEYHRQLHQHA